MAGTIRLKISSAVARYVRPGLGSDDKLRAIGASGGFSAVDRITLLFCLTRDADAAVKSAASATFAALPEEEIVSCIGSPGVSPAILDMMARFHHARPAVAAALLRCPDLSPAAADFLSRSLQPEQPAEQGDGMEAAPEPDEPALPGEPVPEEDEYFSKYQMLQRMGIAEKIKMALTGDKEWRSILINDSNKLVSGSVVKNPRITEAEILQFLKVGVQNDDIIRQVCANKEWVKNYQIRKALVDCPKTPLPNALRFLATLGEKDIASYAKSKNISSVLSTQAKKLHQAKKK